MRWNMQRKPYVVVGSVLLPGRGTGSPALSYLLPYRAATLGALISLLLVSAANLITPQILRAIVDCGISVKNLEAIAYAPPSFAWSQKAIPAMSPVPGHLQPVRGGSTFALPRLRMANCLRPDNNDTLGFQIRDATAKAAPAQHGHQW